MTNEPQSLVSRHAEKVGMRFPIAMVRGDYADRAYGVRAYPAAFLLDARGRVVWADHPGVLGDADIEKHLARQTWIPRLADKRHAKINKALEKNALGQAQAELTKALESTPEDAELRGALLALETAAKALVEDAEAAAGREQYGLAVELYAEAEQLFEGLPVAARAEELRKGIEADPAAEDELAAYELLAEARAYLAKGDERKARAKLDSASKYSGTLSGRDARQLGYLIRE